MDQKELHACPTKPAPEALGKTSGWAGALGGCDMSQGDLAGTGSGPAGPMPAVPFSTLSGSKHVLPEPAAGPRFPHLQNGSIVGQKASAKCQNAVGVSYMQPFIVMLIPVLRPCLLVLPGLSREASGGRRQRLKQRPHTAARPPLPPRPLAAKPGSQGVGGWQRRSRGCSCSGPAARTPPFASGIPAGAAGARSSPAPSGDHVREDGLDL